MEPPGHFAPRECSQVQAFLQTGHQCDNDDGDDDAYDDGDDGDGNNGEDDVDNHEIIRINYFQDGGQLLTVTEAVIYLSFQDLLFIKQNKTFVFFFQFNVKEGCLGLSQLPQFLNG